MSMGMTAATWAAIGATAAVASTYVQYDAAKKSAETQNAQLAIAKESAQTQAKQSDEAINRANQKTPDVAAIMSGSSRDAKGGGGGTMLTGPTGVDINTTSLSKTSLLGG
jgi:multidrug efflux pump subunit AcrA (membrane-fusion protein)